MIVTHHVSSKLREDAEVQDVAELLALPWTASMVTHPAGFARWCRTWGIASDHLVAEMQDGRGWVVADIPRGAFPELAEWQDLR